VVVQRKRILENSYNTGAHAYLLSILSVVSSILLFWWISPGRPTGLFFCSNSTDNPPTFRLGEYMPQPLWYLRYEDRIVGPFPSPRIRELIQKNEINADWQMSLDGVDWIGIFESGQFDLGEREPVTPSAMPTPADPYNQEWIKQRERARHRWLKDENELARAEIHDLSEERRLRQALEQDHSHTDSLVHAEQARRTPAWVGVLALLLVAASGVAVWRWQRVDYDIHTAPGQVANCQAVLGDGVNWTRCNKRGLAAPGTLARNAQLERVVLEESNLAGANLSYATLRQANLRNANLQGINLTGADLSGADLSGSDISQADLRYATLTGVNLAGVRMENARLDKATWVDGHPCAEGAVGQCP